MKTNRFLMIAILLFVFCACSDDDKDVVTPPELPDADMDISIPEKPAEWLPGMAFAPYPGMPAEDPGETVHVIVIDAEEHGRKIMEVLQQQFPGVIILEVEKPVDEWSRRRIGFYQRCGFCLCEKEYVQPSYRKGGETLPMFLMYAGTETIDKEFESIRDEIYRKVYGVESV